MWKMRRGLMVTFSGCLLLLFTVCMFLTHTHTWLPEPAIQGENFSHAQLGQGRRFFSVTELKHRPKNFGSSYRNVTLPKIKKRVKLRHIQDKPHLPPQLYRKMYNMSIEFFRRSVEKEYNGLDISEGFSPGEVVPENQRLHLHISTTWRSGSSFLGELVQSFPGVFYSFEPLQFISFNKHITHVLPSLNKALSTINNLFSCNYKNLRKYIAHLSKRQYNDQLGRNTRVWRSCSSVRSMCFNGQFLSDVCSRSPVNLVKTVRLRVADTRPFLEDSRLNYKLIALFRDPRGVLNSRRRHDWCRKSQSCYDNKVVCQDLEDDISAAENLRASFPDKVKIIRYEELCTSPAEVTEDLFHFLKLHITPSVTRFIELHTKSNGKKSTAFQTVRDSNSTVVKWRNALSYFAVRRIQAECSSPLKKLGYNIFDDWNDLKNLTIPSFKS